MKRFTYSALLSLSLFLFKCHTSNTKADQVDYSVSPVISPAESIKRMQVEDGFEVKLAAAEPLIRTPVALTFDIKGRMWVVEMTNYMPDTLGTGEDVANGRIIILEDVNRDGMFDRRTIFLDSLVLPRAICLIEDGILVAEPPNLWYYKIQNDKPGEKVLVDDAYAVGGNVEHQPNGLLRAMDNWIYNAKSDKRYRKKGDKWLIERTHFRGQWGISQDNYGRLYYNDNSSNLFGDYFAPGLGKNNTNQRRVAGYSERVVADNKVYPARPTTGVNRGYMEGILNDSLRLVNFTAACGPVIYRGDLFGKEYEWNAFVADPSANLIKRNILSEAGYTVNGEQAYEGKEFLTSVDERFRPVNLYNGPDGALYVVDMYRGIIQHKTYLTPYLKNEISQRELSQPLTCGRIYRIIPKNRKVSLFKMPQRPVQLVALLGHANGWVRDMAQQALIDGKYKEVVPALRKAVKETENLLLAIHALWTLEGLGVLQAEEVLLLLKHKEWPLRMQALSVLPSIIDESSYTQYVPVLEQMLAQNDTLAAPYIGFLANYIHAFDEASANRLLDQVVAENADNRYVASAVISNLEGKEEFYLKRMRVADTTANVAIQKQLQQVVEHIEKSKASQNQKELRNAFPKGSALFSSSCQTCHGADGNGVRSLAPPLNKSEWVTGDKRKLAAIVLFGLTGPVSVDGHLYKTPEINGDMPGIGYDKDISDEEVAQLLSYIRKSWQNNADKVSTAEVANVRQKYKDRKRAFTVEELER